MRAFGLALVVSTCVSGAVDAYTIRRSDAWIPTTPCTRVQPGSALDFSSFGFAEGPCGKYGRIVVRGAHFEYERRPGEPLRFMGVNFCEGGNTLPHAEARQLIENLVRLGYNSVRIHHYERAITDPARDGLAFDPVGLDRFDYLMSVCREKGVYVTTDLFVSRRVPWRSIGEDREGQVAYFKTLIHFHEGARSNYLAFARNLLNHVNPYTKCRYADDPTLAWISLVNEGNMGNWDIKPFRQYEHLVLPKWRAWLAARRAADPAYAAVPETLPDAVLKIPEDDRVVAFDESPAANARVFSAKAHVVAFQQFLASCEETFFRAMRTLLRDELGCHALLTDMNGWRFTASGQRVRHQFDYVDDHYYYAHPTFLGPRHTLPARVCGTPANNIRKNDEFGVPYGVTRRLLDRPFTVSEYNFCPPWKNRTSCAFLSGATAALQDWSALWRFCWTCSEKNAVDSAKKSLNHFDMAGDPCATATERAIFCLFMRRDLPALDATYANLYPPSELTKLGEKTEDPTDCLARWVALRAKVGGLVAEQLPAGVACFNRFPPATTGKARHEICADMGVTPVDVVTSVDGAVTVNRRRGTVTVDTPCTAGGFVEEPGTIETRGLRADVAGDSTAVWVSTLDGKPLAESGRLLLTLMSDVQNDGIEYEDETMCVLRRWGKGGRIARRTRARVSLACNGSSVWKVYALRPDGSRKRELAYTREKDRLTFQADVAGDPNEAEFYYELSATPGTP